ncbi:MAG: hypothetical protein Fur0044_16950 [Anaerolineae bacterium]
MEDWRNGRLENGSIYNLPTFQPWLASRLMRSVDVQLRGETLFRHEKSNFGLLQIKPAVESTMAHP